MESAEKHRSDWWSCALQFFSGRSYKEETELLPWVLMPDSQKLPQLLAVCSSDSLIIAAFAIISCYLTALSTQMQINMKVDSGKLALMPNVIKHMLLLSLDTDACKHCWHGCILHVEVNRKPAEKRPAVTLDWHLQLLVNTTARRSNTLTWPTWHSGTQVLLKNSWSGNSGKLYIGDTWPHLFYPLYQSHLF